LALCRIGIRAFIAIIVSEDCRDEIIVSRSTRYLATGRDGLEPSDKGGCALLRLDGEGS
jgi:hypothetical protein